MAVGIYRGVSNVARKVKKEWRGVSNVARQVKSEWRGVNGVARQVFQNELVVFANGAFQNGFSLKTGETGAGTNTAYISGSALYIPYHSSADGICGLTLPSSFDASSFSKMHVDLKFDTVSYCGSSEHGHYEDTDYAWYSVGVRLNGVKGSYSYDIIDDYATNRLTVTLPLSATTDKYVWLLTRCMRDTIYAATPATNIYKIWLE